MLILLFQAMILAPPVDDADFPQALVRFQPFAGNPVFTAEGPGHWDVQIRERGWILHEDGLYHLWFTGYVKRPEGPMSLGYATSKDGIHWQRHPDNPIYNQHWVEDMTVVRDGDRWLMFAEGERDQAQMLESNDRVHWTRVGTLNIRRVDGSPIGPGPFGTPTVIKVGDDWHLFYERMDRGIWHAKSNDLKTWTHVGDEPVLVPGPGAYDARAIAMNQIIVHNGRYYASYHGTGNDGPNRWCSCLAVSDDLVTWKKYANNPLFPPEENKSSGVFVPDGDSYRLYTMHDRVDLHLPAGKQ